ncbi:MAG: haloalkane dehalogenase [Candidatus Hydrogenedentes bacterium]|nr:haloalkane dehalogenase [Candidatus Hydrogenedentota bacterium]
MEFLRTPDERFVNLPGHPFQPHYARYGRMRMHYVDEGPPNADTVLMLHGEPTWSFLYRKMIPIVAGVGHRVIAPDLFGFGRSDKPMAREVYTYLFHVESVTHLIQTLNLTSITLVCQDWGGLIGLRVAAEHPDRFARIVAANTFLPTGDQKLPDAFFQWREFSQTVPVFDVGRIITMGCAQGVADEIVAAYDAPFPDESYKAGARAFPTLVPASPDDPAAAANRRAWDVLKSWEKPFLTAFSDGDPITAGGDTAFQKLVPGCAGQSHTTITGAGHFLQEDKGEELAKAVVDFIAATPPPTT